MPRQKHDRATVISAGPQPSMLRNQSASEPNPDTTTNSEVTASCRTTSNTVVYRLPLRRP
jgi:hypothetical protein